MEKIEKAGSSVGKSVIVGKAESLVEAKMKGNDGSHDAAHAFRVRDLALSLAREEGLLHSMEIVELAALLHDIDDYKYKRDSSEENIIENFLLDEGVDENKCMKILDIIKRMVVTGGTVLATIQDFGSKFTASKKIDDAMAWDAEVFSTIFIRTSLNDSN